MCLDQGSTPCSSTLPAVGLAKAGVLFYIALAMENKTIKNNCHVVYIYWNAVMGITIKAARIISKTE